MESKISVLIADDEPLALDGLKVWLETANNIYLVGEVDTAYSVPRIVQELSPDILIMDLRWYEDITIGWVKIREIKEKNSQIRIIAITAYPELIPDARKAGADEVITKHFHRQDLIDLINEVYARPSSKSPNNSFTQNRNEKLTQREIDVLLLLEKGFSDKEISETLNIKLFTTKNHVKNILQKVNADNRRKAVIKAKSLNLI
jgi:DNA-binding NarL/FixJ family response regulator